MRATSRLKIIAARRSGGRLPGILTSLALTLCLGSLTGLAAGPPNLVLITIDTLRADHVSAYDSNSPVSTPALDSLARDGILFEDVSTSNPLTTPAHASLMTGTWPMRHGVRDFSGYRLDDQQVTLAEALKAAGYSTAAFVSAAVLDHRTGMAQGFDTYNDGFDSFLAPGSTVAERPGRETLQLANHWLESASSPFFLWIHLFEPHDPYLPPEPFRSRFAGRPYAGEVAHTDALLSEFFQSLKSRELWDSSLVTVLSDHGEGLGEHGESRHGFFVYQSTMRIPWLIRLPGAEYRGKRVRQPSSIVDALPTILHALGVERRHWPPQLQGLSRFSAIRGTRSGGGAIYLESMTPRHQFGWSSLKAWRQGKFKFVQAPRPELYDLQQDPAERRNLWRENQSVGLRLQQQLDTFQAGFDPAPSVAAEVDPQLQEQLRSLGYVGVSGPRAEQADPSDPKDKIEAYELMQQGVDAARQRRWPEAIRLLSRAAEREPASPAILSSLALAHRDSGNRAQAIGSFDRLLELTPGDLAMRLEFAQYLIASRMPERARQQLEAILARQPRHFLALFNLGTMEGQQGNLEEAAGYFERAVQVREDPGALVSLALAEAFLGRLGEAEKHLLRAVEIEPANRRAHAQLAEIYQRLGRSEEAERHRKLARGN